MKSLANLQVNNTIMISLTIMFNNNYLITESEVVTGKSQTEALPY